MRNEAITSAGDTRRLLRISGLFLALLAVWKLFLGRTMTFELGPGVSLNPLGEGTLVLLLLAILWRTGLLRQAGFRAPVRLRSMWWGLPFLALAGLTFAGAQDLDTSLTMVVGLAIMVFAGSLTEEIIFRGTLWEGLAGLGPWARSIATSLGFGSIHLVGIASGYPVTVILSQVAIAFSVGLIMAGVRLSAGSIWTVALLHIVFNFPTLWAGGGVEGTLAPGVELQFLTMAVILGAWGCFVIHRQVRASGSARGHGEAPHAEALRDVPA